MLALMAAGKVDHPRFSAASAYLIKMQTRTGCGLSRTTPAAGSSRVFYLRYHGYCCSSPCWAVARYRNLRNTNECRVGIGM